MTQIYRIVCKLSWALGLLSILAAVVIKLAHLEARVTVSSHTAFIVAGAFFLCSIASREMERTQ
jgi:uncharacterized membrane protein